MHVYIVSTLLYHIVYRQSPYFLDKSIALSTLFVVVFWKYPLGNFILAAVGVRGSNELNIDGVVTCQTGYLES